jgi:hypothetical protein
MGSEVITFDYLNNWLLGRELTTDKKDQLLGFLGGLDDSVPLGESQLMGSQNLFWLKAGAERTSTMKGGPKNTDQQLITRLQRERDEIGLWGSEQTSPIYHRFIITGAAVTAITTNNAQLKLLITNNLASFFKYALYMGLDSSEHGLIGMRGTGNNISQDGYPYLHFFIRYFLHGRPENFKEAQGWKGMIADCGWVMASLKGGVLYNFMKDVFELVVDPAFTPQRLRVRTDFFRLNGKPMGSILEKSGNGNTPEIGAFMQPFEYNGKKSKQFYLPINESVRIRQRNTHGEYSWKITNYPRTASKTVLFSYDGLYTELPGGGGATQSYGNLVYIDSKIEILTSSLAGVTRWEEYLIVPSTPPPPPPPTRPPAPAPGKRTPIEKLLHWLKKALGF